MNPDLTTFEKLLAALATAQVDFLCVGGVACSLCGFVRATEDVDIIVARQPANLEKMLAVLRGFGEGAARELTPEDFSDEEGAIRVVEDFPVDIFVRMRGRALEDLLTYRHWHDVAGIRIPYLGAAGLILLKQESWREKDRLDVAALQRLQAEEKA
jgi:hypothetical protein